MISISVDSILSESLDLNNQIIHMFHRPEKSNVFKISSCPDTVDAKVTRHRVTHRLLAWRD